MPPTTGLFCFLFTKKIRLKFNTRWNLNTLTETKTVTIKHKISDINNYTARNATNWPVTLDSETTSVAIIIFELISFSVLLGKISLSQSITHWKKYTKVRRNIWKPGLIDWVTKYCKGDQIILENCQFHISMKTALL